jgi:hypothetical protein
VGVPGADQRRLFVVVIFRVEAAFIVVRFLSVKSVFRVRVRIIYSKWSSTQLVICWQLSISSLPLDYITSHNWGYGGK